MSSPDPSPRASAARTPESSVRRLPAAGPRIAELRRDRILQVVRRHGAAQVGLLSRLLDVSPATVRRDIDTLDRLGLVDRVRGGAVKPGTPTPADDPELPRHLAAIAAAAAQLIPPGSSIGLASTAVSVALATLVARIPAVRLLTHCAPVARAASGRDTGRAAPAPEGTADLEGACRSDGGHGTGRESATAGAGSVTLTGGIAAGGGTFVGPAATDVIAAHRLDIVFLPSCGISADGTVAAPDPWEAAIRRAFLTASQRRVLLADHTCWGVRGLQAFAALDDFDVVLTDARTAACHLAVTAGRVDCLIRL